MALNDKIKKSIDEKVLLEFYQDGQLDLEKVCDSLNIRFLEAEFDDDRHSGYLIKNGDSWTIIVNRTDSPKRKRFTVAHELGHYFSYINNSFSKTVIDSNDGVLQDYAVFARESNPSDETKKMEIEANQIAAHILMPEGQVRKLAEERKNVEEMAMFFGVSESAMTFRLVNLGYQLLESIYAD